AVRAVVVDDHDLVDRAWHAADDLANSVLFVVAGDDDAELEIAMHGASEGRRKASKGRAGVMSADESISAFPSPATFAPAGRLAVVRSARGALPQSSCGARVERTRRDIAKYRPMVRMIFILLAPSLRS